MVWVFNSPILWLNIDKKKNNMEPDKPYVVWITCTVFISESQFLQEDLIEKV